MPLPIPNLDDRSFDDLMKEATSLIPLYNNEWTNHNPSDPGISLLELFAWLCEMIIYRINQIPEETYRRFLALISIEYIFNWDNVPGKDTKRLLDFLIQNYGARWVKIAKIEKSDDGKMITISTEKNSILLIQNDAENKATMTLDVGEIYEFNMKYMFNWDNIPGKDTKRFLDFLIQNYEVRWVEIAAIEKSDDGKMITISAEKNSILLERNDSENKITMTLDAGDPDELSMKSETGEFIILLYEDLEKDIRRGLTSFSRRHRAITSDDYEHLALERMEELQKDLAGRAICMNNRDLEFSKADPDPQHGHVSVIIIPKGEGYVFNWDEIKDTVPDLNGMPQDPIDSGNDRLREFLMQIFDADWIGTAEIQKIEGEGKISIISPKGNYISLILDGEEKAVMTSNIYRSYQYKLLVKRVEEGNGIEVYGYCTGENKPSDLLKDKVKEYLDKRRLITTRVHVVAPDYQEIRLKLCVVLKENTVKQTVIKDAEALINKYFDPLKGGQEGRGWPLGRDIYRSEIFHLLESIPGIDYVEKVEINDKPDNFEEIGTNQLITIGEIVIEAHNE